MTDIMISVIIPTLNEEGYLERCLRSIVAQNVDRDCYEIIVVDGGSTDNTIEIAKKYADLIIISNKRGIGYQQNLGAYYAVGEILAFIHADTYFIKRDIFSKILDRFKDREVVGGAINHIYYPESTYQIKFYNRAGKVLTSLLNLVGKPKTGGPVTLVRKDIFYEIGGFIDMICEDFEINRRLNKKGRMFRDPEVGAYSSSRRFEKEGLFKNIMRYTLSQLLLMLNIDGEIEYPPVR
jgi:glycosyltransferase involved in cell wall biosynthesis